MKIWNKIRLYVLILALILFFIITYQFYKINQRKEKLIDKEYISFLSSQIKENINDKLQISSNVLKYIVNLQYFKEIAVYDSSGKELFSMAKGSIGADTTMIEKLITNHSTKDSLLFTGDVYIKVIQIKSILNNTPIGKAILVITPHFSDNYLMFVKRQLYLVGVFILLLLISFIKFPQQKEAIVEQMSQEKEKGNELIEILEGKKEQSYEEPGTKKESTDKTNLLNIKRDITKKLEEIITMIEQKDQTKNIEYNIGLENSLESMNDDIKQLENNIISLEKENTTSFEKSKQFIRKLKEEIGKIEYFANRLRILSYNAMILANSSGSEGGGFKVVAEEMENLSDRIFKFQSGIEDEINRANLECESSVIEKIKSNIAVMKEHVTDMHEDRENENKKLNDEIKIMIKSSKDELTLQYKNILNDFSIFLEDIFSNLNS